MNISNPSCLSRLIRLFLLAAVAIIPVVSDAQDSPERQFDAISRLLEKADLALDDNKTTDAARLYGASLAAYRDFAERFPEHQVELVRFRASYCRQQLMNLLAQKKATERLAAQPAQSGTTDQAIRQGVALCLEGRFADAEAAMHNPAGDAAASPMHAMVMATARLGSGDLDASRQHILRALEKDPQNGAAHYNLVQLMLRDPAPDYEAAREHYRQARRAGVPADTDLESVLDL